MRKKHRLLQIVIVLGLLALWQFLVTTNQGTRVPAPSDCCVALYQLISQNILLPDILSSLNRVLVGFSFALAFGLIFGFLMGMIPLLKSAVMGVLELLRPIPPIAWIPIAVSILGIGNASAWFVIFVGAFFPILTNTLLGVSSVEKVHIEAAKVLGASKLRSFTGVILPSTLPSIFAGVRVGLGFAWMCVVAAEMFAARSGLGYAIQLNRQLLRLDRVVAYMVIIAVIGYLMTRLISYLEKVCIPWKRDFISKDYFDSTSKTMQQHTLPTERLYKQKDEISVNIDWKHIKGASIEINNLKFQYPNSRELILNGTNLSVKSGEVFCILGLSGCGKSTLLRLLAGLENGYSGSIQIDGEELNGYREDTTMVFQDFSLFPWRKVARNVHFALEQHKNEAKEQSNIEEQYLQLVGLQHKAKDYPYLLSGGQMQRVAFARALASRPRLMLLDEPFSALDIYTREAMQVEISEIFRQSGITVIMVTHDISEAIFMADRIAVMAPHSGFLSNEYHINFPRPRDKKFRNSVEFKELSDILWNQINL
ncbi:MAG: ATP-binding cassette domain-containing protein [Bacteroidales bacterium]|nr:ATP-binding cassette domain-containing protein [Bacteroidales bacterium]